RTPRLPERYKKPAVPERRTESRPARTFPGSIPSRERSKHFFSDNWQIVSSSLHKIPYAFFRAYEIFQPGFLQLSAKPCHIDRQRIVVDKAVGLPEPHHQRIPAHSLSFILQDRKSVV